MSDEFYSRILLMRGVKKRDLSILRYYSGLNDNSAGLEKLFEGQLPQTQSVHEAVSLYKLGQKYGWKGIPEETSASYKSFCQRENLRTTWIVLQCMRFFKRLNEESIPFVVLKGGALKICYLDKLVRKMSDLDICVPDEYYNRCNEVAAEMGFERKVEDRTEQHSVDYLLDGQSLLDIHRRVYKSNVLRTEDWESLTMESRICINGGAQIQVPCLENVFLHILINGLDNLVVDIGDEYNPFFVIDLIELKQQYNLNYDRLAQLIKNFRLENKFCSAVKLMNAMLPDYFSDETLLAESLSQNTARTLLWQDQVLKLLSLGNKCTDTSFFSRLLWSVRYNWLFSCVMYLTEIPKHLRFWYFLKVLKVKYSVNSVSSALDVLKRPRKFKE